MPALLSMGELCNIQPAAWRVAAVPYCISMAFLLDPGALNRKGRLAYATLIRQPSSEALYFMNVTGSTRVQGMLYKVWLCFHTDKHGERVSVINPPAIINVLGPTCMCTCNASVLCTKPVTRPATAERTRLRACALLPAV